MKKTRNLQPPPTSVTGIAAAAKKIVITNRRFHWMPNKLRKNWEIVFKQIQYTQITLKPNKFCNDMRCSVFARIGFRNIGKLNERYAPIRHEWCFSSPDWNIQFNNNNNYFPECRLKWRKKYFINLNEHLFCENFACSWW